MRRILASYVHKKLNLDELAESLHMSKSNIIRIFKKKYNVTPYEYVISLRIETAKILLRDTKLSIREIADKLVFFDEHYFSSLFLKKVGVRPGIYRNTSRD
jgi:transcriptional regulator GlxA family with amidase domain